MKPMTMLCSLLFTLIIQSSVFAQDKNYDEVQFYKGRICDVKVGNLIGDLLRDGEKIMAEKYNSYGYTYFIFDVPISNCGLVKVHAGGQWMEIVRVETDYQKYSTTRGASVGMTLGELKVLYPEVEHHYPNENYQNYSFGFFLPEDEGFFSFEAEHLKEKCEQDYDACKSDFDDLRAVSFVTY